jgi:AbrB family looped-hinge helix DNA binding protein
MTAETQRAQWLRPQRPSATSITPSHAGEVVTKRGQTVIPAAIRKRYQIREGDSLVWIDDGATIRVIPVARDSIQALRGSGRGEALVARLLAARREDRQRDR